MFLRYKIEKWAESSAQRVGLFSIGSGIGNIPNIGLDRSVEICARAFLGIYFSLGYFRVFQGILDIICFLEVLSQTLGIISNIY